MLGLNKRNVNTFQHRFAILDSLDTAAARQTWPSTQTALGAPHIWTIIAASDYQRQVDCFSQLLERGQEAPRDRKPTRNEQRTPGCPAFEDVPA